MLSAISNVSYNKKIYKNVSFGAKVDVLDAMETILKRPSVPNEAQINACKQMAKMSHIKPNQLYEIFAKCRRVLIQDPRMQKVVKDYLETFKGRKERPHDIEILTFKLKAMTKIFKGERQIELPDVKM